MYAQRNILTQSLTWAIHLRADASPQGGRDFFVAEYDWCFMTRDIGASQEHVESLLKTEGMLISKRILPLSILGQRASSAVHKAQQLLKVLAMESESLQFTIGRTFTLLTDFGAESGMFNLPAEMSNPDGSAGTGQIQDVDYDDCGAPSALDSTLQRLFSKAMPIADCDHSLHHDPWAKPSCYLQHANRL